jgi:hypothetical protein
MAFARTRPDVLQVRLLDMHGRELVRINRDGGRVAPATELQARYTAWNPSDDIPTW